MISNKEVKHIAELARLSLSEAELKKMRKELASILDYIELLKEADVSKSEPTSHVIPVTNVMREDILSDREPEARNNILGQLPSREGDFCKVREILK